MARRPFGSPMPAIASGVPAMAPLLWLKSGQCDVRSTPLALTPVALEVLFSARLSAPPQLALQDLVEKSVFPLVCSSAQPYGRSSLFKVATYSVSIYPQASYAVASQQNVENPPIQRPFPADPSALGTVSRFAWERAIGSMPFRRSLPFRFRSNLRSHRASRTGSPPRFPLVTVQLTKRCPQHCNWMEPGR